jgi:uncharacterized protein YjbJ (UPF0337 family)
MTELDFKNDWNITKRRLRQRWAMLTEDDLQFTDGKRDELVSRIQKRTGASRKAVEAVLRSDDAVCRGN